MSHNSRDDAFDDYISWNLMGASSLAIFGAVIIALSAIAGTYWWIAAPYIARHEHVVNTQSHQYQEARRESSIILEQNIAKIDVDLAKTSDPVVRASLQGQRAALENRLKRETAKQGRHSTF